MHPCIIINSIRIPTKILSMLFVRAQELIKDYNTYLHTIKTERNTNLNKRHDIKLWAMHFRTIALNVLELWADMYVTEVWKLFPNDFIAVHISGIQILIFMWLLVDGCDRIEIIISLKDNFWNIFNLLIGVSVDNVAYALVLNVFSAFVFQSSKIILQYILKIVTCIGYHICLWMPQCNKAIDENKW